MHAYNFTTQNVAIFMVYSYSYILQFAVTVTVVASATNIKRIEWLSAGMTQDVGQECSRVNAHKVCSLCTTKSCIGLQSSQTCMHATQNGCFNPVGLSQLQLHYQTRCT